MALGSLMNPKAMAKPADPLAAKAPHFPAKAKRVIYLHLTGSPPNLDLYDYKPELVKRDGQDCPAEFLKGRSSLSPRALQNCSVRGETSSNTEKAVCGCPTRFPICTKWRMRCA